MNSRVIPVMCLLLIGVVLIEVSRSFACCMIPEQYSGKIGQAEQKGLVIHRDGVQDLILGITYEIKPSEDGSLPPKLTWLIALPAEPMEEAGYGLADRALFDELDNLAMSTLVKHLPSRSNSVSKGVDSAALPEATPEGVELGRAVTVGPYDIQPVRGVGQNALEGLNNYLQTRGFPAEDPDHMAWFVEHGFTFLCIEVTPKQGEASLSAGEPLPPLRVRFDTEYPYYPLRYSSQQGDFTLALYTLTSKPIDLESSNDVLKSIGWQNTPGSRTDFARAVWKQPQQVKSKTVLDAASGLKSLPEESLDLIKQNDAWTFGLFMARPNPQNRPISNWNGDCFLTLKDQPIAPLGTSLAAKPTPEVDDAAASVGR